MKKACANNGRIAKGNGSLLVDNQPIPPAAKVFPDGTNRAEGEIFLFLEEHLDGR